MASSVSASVTFVIKEMVVYGVIPMFIIGVIGGCLNVIIFLSLKTFRQSSCAFYLMVMSMFDVSRFFLSVLPYLMRRGFETDWGVSSLFFCKIRFGLFSTSTLSSMTCLCLAIIDQYFATSFCPRWQQWCSIQLAHRLTTIFSIIWILHAIPYFVFLNHVTSPLTNQTECQVTNNIFNQYISYGYYIVLTNLLPLIAVVFGLIAYYNARHLGFRTVPLVRRELDKQLTVMVLVQILITFCTLVPFSANNIFVTIKSQETDPVFVAKQRLSSSIISNINILNFAVRIFGIIFRQMKSYIRLFSSAMISESILHIHVCLETVSSTIQACFLRDTCQTLSKSCKTSKSNSTRRYNNQ